MGTRYFKCQLKECGKMHEYKLKDSLIVEEIEFVGKDEKKKIKRKYYCDEDHYNKSKKIDDNKEKERVEQDEIDKVVKKLYGVGDKYNLPPRWWSIIQDLRNGTNRYQKFWKKRYKKGIPYPVIAEAFRLSKDTIRWASMNKRFNSVEQELMYGLAVMQAKLIDAERKLTKTKIQEKRASAIEKVQLEMMEDNREVVYKKQKSDDDFSYLLGDD